MPSSATISSFNIFTPTTVIKSAEVNSNFDAMRGHIIPVDPTASAAGATQTWDLGSIDHSWRGAYNQYSVMGVNSTSTSVPVLTTTSYGLYFKTDGNLYKKASSGTEAIIGSGSGGVKNLIDNGDADYVDVSIFTAYADAAATRPVDGTGGSPTVTTSVSSSTPLDGLKSFLLTKTAVNSQGQGWSVQLDVDPAYRAKSLKISFDYILNSGTFTAASSTTESDVIVYLYDVTNSLLIEPSNIKLFSNSSTISDKFESTFQTSSSGSSYRLILHIQSTSTSAYELKIDNVTISPQVYVFGTPVTDYVAYTPVITHDSGSMTNKTVSAFYKRVGDEYHIQGQISITGANTFSGIYVSIPNGAIDTTKIPSTGTYTTPLGIVNILDTGVNLYSTGSAMYASTTTIALLSGSYVTTHAGTVAGLSAAISNTFPFSIGSGDSINFSFKVPIAGMSSSVQISNGADTTVFSVFYSLSANQTIPYATSTKIGFNTKSIDKQESFNTSNNRLTVNSAGLYSFIVHGVWEGVTTSYESRIEFHKNGVVQNYSYNPAKVASAGTIAHGFTATITLELKAGDYVEVFAWHATGTLGSLYLFGDSSLTKATTLEVSKLSGPSAIAMSELVGFSATRTTNTTVSTGVTTDVIFNSSSDASRKEFNSHGSYDSSTGIFTANVAGRFLFSFSIIANSTSAFTAVEHYAHFYDSSNTLIAAGTQLYWNTQALTFSGTCSLNLVVGNTVKVRINATSAGTITLYGAAFTGAMKFSGILQK